tara:strand:- start:534 stop:692 length:159 start_codon:yes stop_codon:yes gene_type:complete
MLLSRSMKSDLSVSGSGLASTGKNQPERRPTDEGAELIRAQGESQALRLPDS